MNPETTYRISNDLKFRVQGGCRLSIFQGGGQYDFPLAALGILQQFSRPMTFAEAAADLSASGTNDWIHQTSILKSLIDIGVLLPVSESKSSPQATIEYGSASIHIEMLNDRVRTHAYQQAIRDLVKPGDCVLDIGTGTGVLAITAALAGAGKVYALEANPATADIARFCIEKNGVSDVVEVIEGWSTQVEIPQRADLIVSEMFGNDPFDEDILLIYADAAKRFAKPEARLIPQGFDLCCAPLYLSTGQLAHYIPDQEMLTSWKRDFGIDFSVLATLEYSDDRPLFYAKPQKMASSAITSEGFCLGYVDLTHSQPLSPEFCLSLEGGLKGQFNALILYFDTELSPGNRLNLSPRAADANNHWRMPVWYLHKTLEISEAGDQKICFERTSSGKNRLFIK